MKNFYFRKFRGKSYNLFEGTQELKIIDQVYEAVENSKKCKNMWVIESDINTVSNYGNIDSFNNLISAKENEFDTIKICRRYSNYTLYLRTTGKPKGAELTHSNILFNAF